ncbi:OmpH family outer membrane protein [Hymenobacter sp. J193]|uniref:OmpH family outer membrane protein n=1 Tax=Hymenobacter sp. J193 TaxID=2898429 RepID=UPI002150A1E1|nr:OmpH family outer membrane protein [Hymenobacter sp. J193]MCR5886650.1 OmpH family outer membrane protein [Hymenobacter sp. J193]
MKTGIHLNRLFFICGTAFCFLTCSQQKYTYINPVKLVDGYHGTAPHRQQLLTANQAWQANLDSLARELQAQPAAQRAAKEQELLRYREAAQQKAQAEEARVQQALLEEINAYIKQYGKEHDYAFIFGATNQGNIVYAAESTDLTNEILAGLNQQYDAQHPSE